MTDQQKAEELYPIRPSPYLLDNQLTLARREGFLTGCAFAQSEAVSFGEWMKSCGYVSFTIVELYEKFKIQTK